MKNYDIIVIGSGGGMKIALPAASMGLKTAFIEEDAVGGTCLNRGCIPSKMLIYPTELPDLIREADRINVKMRSDATVEFEALMKRISETVDGISANLRTKVEQTPNLDFYPVHCEFIADKVIRAGEDELTADKIFIASGSRPLIPEIPGLRDTPFITSKEALGLSKLPDHILVIGAGYIAVELGSAYAAAGSNVEFIVRSRFLRKEDKEIAEAFSDVFKQTHTVYQGFAPKQVEFKNGSFNIACENASGKKQTLKGDTLLVAAGFTPCTDDLGLVNTGIKTDENGYIKVDDHLRTDVKGVYALGDCVGNYLFRHTVNYEGEYLVRTVLTNEVNAPIDYGPVPHAVFSSPEIAAVGMTQEHADEQGKDYIVGKALYADSNAGLARGYQHGFVKILIERSSHQILGAHILGDEASDMIHLFIAAMKMKGTVDDLLNMIFIHPALPEVARDAARDAGRQLGILNM